MVQEALELAAYFRSNHAEDLAKQAGDLAEKAKELGLLSIKGIPKIELPIGLEGKIRRETIIIGGITREQLKRQLKAGPFRLGESAEYLIDRAEEFDTPGEPEEIKLIFPRVRDMGLTGIQTTDQVYQRGFDLGWSLCSRRVGPYLRTQDPNQPLGDVYWIAMKQMTGRSGNPRVFELERDEDGLWLSGSWVRPTGGWNPEDQLVFGLRKDTPKP